METGAERYFAEQRKDPLYAAAYEAAAAAETSTARRTDIKHGICRPCGRRRILWLPAALCEKCLRLAAERLAVDVARNDGTVEA